jgi:hypothetical protein
MDSNTSSKKEDEDVGGSQEASPRTSISSNASNFILPSPSVINNGSEILTPRHSIDELRELHYLSRQALSRRLSTLSADSGYSEVGDSNLNWNSREAGINGILP